MTEVRRTNLEWARDIARSYRAALRAVDPERCDRLDKQARARGQRWIAPTFVPALAADEAQNKLLTPKQLEEFWGVPAATIYGWASKGLLANHGRKGAPKFRVSEVIACDGRGRRTA